MEKIHSFFSDNKTISESFFVRVIEKLFKVRLSGFPSYICYAVGNSLLFSVSITFFMFTGSFFFFGDQPSQIRVDTTWSAFKFTFIILCLTSFITVIRPSLLAWMRPVFEKRIVLITSIISALALAACIALTIKHFPIFALNQASGNSESQQLEDPTAKPGSGSSHVNVNEAAKQPLLSDTGKSTFFGKTLEDLEKMSLGDLNQWLKSNGVEDIDLETRTKLIEQGFSEISLFDVEPDDVEIHDMDAFFLELNQIAGSKPHAVSQGISQLIMSNPSFDTLVEVLNRGYSFNGSHVSMLSGKLSVEELQTLESYGIDLAATSSSGSNALVGSLFNSKNRDVFDYLLSIDRVVHSEEVNVLKEVLDYSSMLSYDFTYAQKVLDRGVEVTEETASWIENDLKQNDLGFYKKVKERIDLN